MEGDSGGVIQRIRLVLDQEAAAQAAAQAEAVGDRIATAVEGAAADAGAASGSVLEDIVKRQDGLWQDATGRWRDASGKFVTLATDAAQKAEKPMAQSAERSARTWRERMADAWNRIRGGGVAAAQGVGGEHVKQAGLATRAWGTVKNWAGSQFGQIAGAIGATFAVTKLAGFTKDLVTLGMSASETASKFRTTFGGMSDDVQSFVDSWGPVAGLNRMVGQEMTATAGAIIQGMGATRRESAAFSQDMLRLAGDLQSFHDVPIDETFGAIKSALAGSWEPLDRFGIVIRQADVDARALTMSGKTLASQLTAQDRAVAALRLAYERAGPAIGDLERTQNSDANTVRRLAAVYENWKLEMAARLAPTISQLIGWLDRNKDTIAAVATATLHLTGVALSGLWQILSALVDLIGGAVLYAFGGITTALVGIDRAVANVTEAWGKLRGFLGDDAGARRMQEQADLIRRRADDMERYADAALRAARSADERLQQRMGMGGQVATAGRIGPAGLPGAATAPTGSSAAAAGAPDAGDDAKRPKSAEQLAAEAKARAATAAAANKALDERIGKLGAAMALERTRAQAETELQRIQSATLAQLARKNLSLDETIVLSERLRAVQTALGGIPFDNRTLSERVELLGQALGYERTRGEALEKLAAVAAEVDARLADAGLTLPVRVELEGQRAAVQGAQRDAAGALQALERELTEQLARADVTVDVRARLQTRLDDVRAQLARLPAELRAANVDALPIEARLQVLTTAQAFAATRAEAEDGLRRLEGELQRMLADDALPLPVRVELQGNLDTVQGLLGTAPLENKSWAERVALLERMAASETMRRDGIAGLQRAESELEAELRTGNLTLERRLELEEQLRQVRDALGATPVESLGTDDQIRLLQEAVRYGDTRVEGVRGLLRLEKELEAQLANENLTLQQRIRLERELADVRGTLDEGGNRAIPGLSGAADVLAGGLKTVFQATEDVTPPGFGWLDSVLQTMTTTLPEAADSAAAFVADRFSVAFDLLLDDASRVGEAFKNFGKGLAKSVLGQIGQMAKGKALENAAWAVEEGAKGFAALARFDGRAAAMHFKSSAGHILSTVKWGLVGGAVGSLAGGGGGGGAGVESGAGRTGGAAVDEKKNPPTQLVIHGGVLSTDDHRQMDALGKAMKEVTGRDFVISRTG